MIKEAKFNITVTYGEDSLVQKIETEAFDENGKSIYWSHGEHIPIKYSEIEMNKEKYPYMYLEHLKRENYFMKTNYLSNLLK